MTADRIEKKQAHWQAVIFAAPEQSGRNHLAHLAPLTSLNAWLGQQDLHKRILLSPRGEESLSNWARHQSPQSATLLIGPKGGFTEAEENTACTQGALMFLWEPEFCVPRMPVWPR